MIFILYKYKYFCKKIYEALHYLFWVTEKITLVGTIRSTTIAKHLQVFENIFTVFLTLV